MEHVNAHAIYRRARLHHMQTTHKVPINTLLKVELRTWYYTMNPKSVWFSFVLICANCLSLIQSVAKKTRALILQKHKLLSVGMA